MEMELSGEGNGKRVETKGQRAAVWLMFLCGFFYFEWICNSNMGLGVALFTMLFCAASYWYMEINGFRQTGVSLFYLGLTGISALNFVLIDNGYLGGLNFLLLSCAAVYWICVTTGQRINGDLSVYMVGDFLNQLVLRPFGNFGAGFEALKQGSRTKKEGEPQQQDMRRREHQKNMLFGVLGLVVAAPILLTVVRLLSSADAAFEELMGRLQFSFSLPENWIEYAVELVAAIPLACYLFGLLHANVSQKKTVKLSKEGFDAAGVAVRVLPKAACYTAVGALILIYLVFFATQTAYLFSAFRSSLPITMTYAEYARRGFFELCAIAGINLFVMTVAYLLTARGDSQGMQGKKEGTPRGLRMEVGALCLLTVMLISTALSKMVLYIHYYGLTQLRFYTTWFMVVMLLLFIIIGVRQIKSFPCGRWLIMTVIAGFLTLSYCNADGLIASYNIDRYKEGTLESLDVYALYSLSDGAVKPAYALYLETEDGDLKSELFRMLAQNEEGGFRVLDNGSVQVLDIERDYRSWNYQRWQAQQLREQVFGENSKE